MRNAILVALLMSILFLATAHGKVDESLVLALGFDEGSGSVAKDSSQYGNDGKVVDAKWVDGKYGGGLEFDGAGAHVQVDDAPELLLLDGGTIMVWAYIMTDGGHASWPRICIKSNTNGGTHGYDLLFDRGAGYAVRFCIGGACNSFTVVETDTWKHVAVTFDGSELLIYVDGEQTAQGTQPGPAVDTTGLPLIIGNGVAIDRPYRGLYDEFKIWDRPLEPEEIKEQMNMSVKDLLSVEPSGKYALTWGRMKTN